jgi:uncharacterized protein
MLTQSDRQLAEQFKSRLSQSQAGVSEVIVFGSRARGSSTETSDLDLLVLVESISPETREQIYDCAWEIGFEAGVFIQTIIKERARVEGLERDSLLMLQVAAEGISV